MISPRVYIAGDWSNPPIKLVRLLSSNGISVVGKYRGHIASMVEDIEVDDIFILLTSNSITIFDKSYTNVAKSNIIQIIETFFRKN